MKQREYTFEDHIESILGHKPSPEEMEVAYASIRQTLESAWNKMYPGRQKGKEFARQMGEAVNSLHGE